MSDNKHIYLYEGSKGECGKQGGSLELPEGTAADKCGNNKDGHTQHDFNEVQIQLRFFQ